MKTGETETPNIATWITQQLHPGDLVSSDPKIVPFQDWLNWNSTLGILFSKIDFYNFLI